MCQYYDSRVAIYEHKMFYRIDHRHTGLYSLFNSTLYGQGGSNSKPFFIFIWNGKRLKEIAGTIVTHFSRNKRASKTMKKSFLTKCYFPERSGREQKQQGRRFLLHTFVQV